MEEAATKLKHVPHNNTRHQVYNKKQQIKNNTATRKQRERADEQHKAATKQPRAAYKCQKPATNETEQNQTRDSVTNSTNIETMY